MRPLTSQFSASVARRDQVVKKTCVGPVPRTAAATDSASSRSARSGSIRSSSPLGSRLRPEDLPTIVRAGGARHCPR